MKKQLPIIWFISVFMLCACGNNKTNSNDNIIKKDSLATEPSDHSFIVTKDGVGSLKKKKPFTDMSKSNEGLYNNVKKEPFYDEPSGMTFDAYTLYLDNTKVASFMVEKSTSPIESLAITSPHVSLPNGIKVGTPIRDALDKKGVIASASYDVMMETALEALISISFEGIELNDYYLGEGELTESGIKKIRTLTMENDSVSLNKSDFKPESKISGFYLPREW